MVNEDEYFGPSVVPNMGLDDTSFIKVLIGIGATMFLSFSFATAAAVAILFIFKKQLIRKLKSYLIST